MIDIDDFKLINDTHGHIAGDDILRQLAEILRDNVRNKDIVSRWGGEEFAIILPDTNSEDAVKLGERIRMVVREHNFCYEIDCIRITVSIGVATIDEAIESDSFVKLADKALYQAKENKDLVIPYNKLL